MTNKELLEAAARAAGIAIDHWRADMPMVNEAEYDANEYHAWNPLTDDGDALRLAAKLQMGLAVFKDYTEATDGIRVDATETVYDLPDIYAATRRTIVRVAAEIGKAMQ